MWVTVPDPDDNPDNSPKMKIIFVILLLALIGELTYFFYIAPNKKPSTKVAPAFAPTLIPPTPAETLTPISPTIFPTKQEFTGKIIGFENITEELNPKEYKANFFLHLLRDDEKSKIKLLLNFDKNELSNFIVKDFTGKTISYKNLKIDKNIKISGTYDLNNRIYSNYEITILN
ncbi:MAG: hypothetical protein AAB441_01120 [Patescibacteria group bacterium]